MLRFSRWLLVLMLLATGCSNATDSENEGSTSTTSGTSGQQTSSQQSQSTPNIDGIWPKPLAKPRKSMKGNWVVNVFMEGKEFPICLLKVNAEEENSLTAKVLDVPSQIGKAILTSSEMTETSAIVVLEVESSQFPFEQVDFQGTLKDGVVIGNILLNEMFCVPARLIATNDGGFPTTIQLQTGPYIEEFTQARKSLKNSGSLTLIREFSKDHPESPTAIDAFRILFSQVANEKLEVELVEQLAENYLATARRWGSRLETFTYLQMGGNLAAKRYLPETALKFFDEIQGRLTDDSPEQWNVFLESSKKLVKITYSIARLSHENADVRKQSAEEIHQYQKQQPFNHRILFALADNYERQNQPDEAINWYAQLTVVLPLIHPNLRREWLAENEDHPLPSEALAELWKKKHGKTDGLDSFLDEVYEKSVFSFLPGTPEPRTSAQGNRIVLCELFTGALCPPCVAADIATGALEKIYPSSEIIVLRYHQHIPGPDQLTNQDSEARAGYYEIQGTPSLFLKGRGFPGVPGFPSEVEFIFNNLREAIDLQLSETTEISLKLSANVEDGVLNLSVEVEGLENPARTLRLRLVLAEEEIYFQAGNGIRKHEMIVRSMPGGVGGIAPKEGKLHFSKSVKLSDMRQKLMDYLAAFEEGNNFEFPVKPLALEKLHLVAFVQDDSTQEVLQAAAIPVTGMHDTPNSPKPEAPAPQETGRDETKPVEASKPK
ncbi:MAG: hypothetical protein IID46_07185 [Planctomycetes bacterium]|nr:hypothetical protein [Planctomycetota bacterium]